MVWYYAVLGVAVTVALGLLIPYIRRRYIDTVACGICGARYPARESCPRCGGRF